MKKSRIAKQFLKELQKTPIMSAVCVKLNLSRQTIFRWLKEDADFEKEYSKCLFYGKSNINDLAESKLISAIDQGKEWSIKFWLQHNKANYSIPRPKFLYDEDKPNKKVDKIVIEYVDFTSPCIKDENVNQ